MRDETLALNAYIIVERESLEEASHRRAVVVDYEVQALLRAWAVGGAGAGLARALGHAIPAVQSQFADSQAHLS